MLERFGPWKKILKPNVVPSVFCYALPPKQKKTSEAQIALAIHPQEKIYKDHVWEMRWELEYYHYRYPSMGLWNKIHLDNIYTTHYGVLYCTMEYI